MVGRGRGGGYYYFTLQAVSLSASLSPHLFLSSSSWLPLACSPHSTPAHPAFGAAVAPAPSNPPCARATGREQGSCARTAYAAFFRLDQTVPVWHLALASALALCTAGSMNTRETRWYYVLYVLKFIMYNTGPYFAQVSK